MATPRSSKSKNTSNLRRALPTIDSVLAYVELAARNGMLVGIPGNFKISPRVEALVDAFHSVLAGGEIQELKVKGPVNKALKTALNKQLKTSISDLSEWFRDNSDNVKFG